MNKYIAIIVFVITAFSLKGQEVLKWDEVVNLALEKNFGIRLMKNEEAIAKNLNHAGNAGYLPTLDVGASQNWASNDVRLEFFSGDVNELDAANSTSTNLFAELNWTFFDGFRMFARDGLLDERERLASVKVRAEMESLIFELAMIYLQGVKLHKELKILEENLELSEFRYAFLQNKVDAGAGSKTQLIQAELDKNNDKAQIIRKETELVQNKFELIQLMGYERSDAFQYDNEFSLSEPQLYTDAAAALDSLNPDLLMARIQTAEATYQKRISQSEFYPQLSMNAAYNFNNSTSEAGILFSNRSLGPSLTLNLRWNVFGSLNRIKNVKNAKINLASAQIFKEQVKFTKETELKKYYQTYASILQVVELDQENASRVQEQIKIAESAFKNGQIDALELREIQFSIQQIKLNQMESQLQLGMAIANIDFLSGSFQQLIQQ